MKQEKPSNKMELSALKSPPLTSPNMSMCELITISKQSLLNFVKLKVFKSQRSQVIRQSCTFKTTNMSGQMTSLLLFDSKPHWVPNLQFYYLRKVSIPLLPQESNSPLASKRNESLQIERRYRRAGDPDLKSYYFSVSKMWVKEMESSIGIHIVICVLRHMDFNSYSATLCVPRSSV